MISRGLSGASHDESGRRLFTFQIPEFSSGKPTADGWYWWRQSVSHKPFPVRLEESGHVDFNVDVLFDTGYLSIGCAPSWLVRQNSSYGGYAEVDGEWAGPLEAPQ